MYSISSLTYFLQESQLYLPWLAEFVLPILVHNRTKNCVTGYCLLHTHPPSPPPLHTHTRSLSLSLFHTLQWAEQLFRAIDHLHSNTPPIVHRDIKPANIMLTADFKTVKVFFPPCHMCIQHSAVSRLRASFEITCYGVATVSRIH